MDHRPSRTFVENTFKLKVPEINGHRSSWLKTKCCILHKRVVQLSGPDLQIRRQKTVSPHRGKHVMILSFSSGISIVMPRTRCGSVNLLYTLAQQNPFLFLPQFALRPNLLTSRLGTSLVVLASS